MTATALVYLILGCGSASSLSLLALACYWYYSDHRRPLPSFRSGAAETVDLRAETVIDPRYQTGADPQ
jgi:hypothetical protein